MSACPTLRYTGVTAARWVAVKAKAEAELKIVIAAADAGSDTAEGFTMSWAYDAPDGTLAITCTDSPWWAACSTINGEIDAMIRPLLTP